ncbi:MAG: MBL fold metallo-hydrolase [Anaerolineae bacterium]
MAQTARLILLGTAAIADPTHDNVYMVLDSGESRLLIDCGGSPSSRVMQAGLRFTDLDGLIVTHHHPDHIYGVPVLLMNLWLLGRRGSFPIYGPGKSLEVIGQMMALYEWDTWPEFLQVNLREIPLVPDTPVLSDGVVSIVASPVAHLIPAIGLRITNQQTGKVLVYTSDTMRDPCVVDLARNADILIHEATGKYYGHSTGSDAARDALEANAGQLVLIHYPSLRGDPEAVLEEARALFQGPVELAEDFRVYEF